MDCRKLIGGWSQNLSLKPFPEFKLNMYGMVTDLATLKTGSGWGPKSTPAPNFGNCQILWTYGGGGCYPSSKPATDEEIDAIVQATKNNKWDGVDFDDECNMNIDNVIKAMKKLKNAGKQTSYGFIAGWAYNNPDSSENGRKINKKVVQLAESEVCDRFIHYCYAVAMWTMDDIKKNVRQALKRTINNGVDRDRIILALTSSGLNDTNLNYFLDEVIDLDIGGLFIWRYHELTDKQRNLIIQKLNINPKL